jgi:hypothetical protein
LTILPWPFWLFVLKQGPPTLEERRRLEVEKVHHEGGTVSAEVAPPHEDRRAAGEAPAEYWLLLERLDELEREAKKASGR